MGIFSKVFIYVFIFETNRKLVVSLIHRLENGIAFSNGHIFKGFYLFIYWKSRKLVESLIYRLENGTAFSNGHILEGFYLFV